MIRTPEGRYKSVIEEEDAQRELKRMVAGMSPEELAVFHEAMFDQQIRSAMETGWFCKRPVSMEQFLDDPYYLGESAKTLFPAIRRDLIELFSGSYHETIIGGGIGIGKTTLAAYILIRLIYELSCLTDPHGAFGLTKGTELSIPLVSKNLQLAKRVLLSAVNDKLKLSPYFLREFTPIFRQEETIFPYNVHLFIASYASDKILGTSVIFAAMDEANFPPGKQKQVITRQLGEKANERHYDIVEKIYTSMVGRIASRLQQAGGYTPGMVILTSSAGTVNSFTDRRIRDSKDRNDVFIRDHVAWTAKPKWKFSGGNFRVLAGTSSLQSRIIPDDEEIDYDEIAKKNGVVLEIPLEYKRQFEQNLEDSLRDVAGISTMAISPFIQRMEALEACIRYDKVHPFAVQSWVANTPPVFHWNQLVKATQRQVRPGVIEESYQPLRNPTAPRWIHIDLSKSRDSTGIAMAHIAKWVPVEHMMPDGKLITELAPYFVVDFVLDVVPPHGEQIFYGDIRKIIGDFQAHGFYIMGVSADTYQSVDMLQQLQRNWGIRTYEQSVDTTTAPYDALKSAIYEGRIEFYNYPPLFDQLRALEYDRDKGRVDHPKAGAKDTSDSVAASIYMLLQKIGEMPLERRLMDSEDPTVSVEQRIQQNIFPDRVVGRVDPEEIMHRHNAQQEGNSFPIPFI